MIKLTHAEISHYTISHPTLDYINITPKAYIFTIYLGSMWNRNTHWLFISSLKHNLSYD